MFNNIRRAQTEIMRLFLALSLLCSVAGFAHARASVSIKHTSYPISGATSHDLRAEMEKAGPGARSKGEGDARTKWGVRWGFGLQQVSGGCRVHDVSTSVNVTFIMPRWKNAAKGSPELRARWQTYMKALQNHEDGHRDLGIKAAQEIESVLSGLGPMRSCSEMERTANATASDILNSYKKKEEYYDILTIHGKTQGASFR
jgi:predicted secreted Zn-dependent protease